MQVIIDRPMFLKLVPRMANSCVQAACTVTTMRHPAPRSGVLASSGGVLNGASSLTVRFLDKVAPVSLGIHADMFLDPAFSLTLDRILVFPSQ